MKRSQNVDLDALFDSLRTDESPGASDIPDDDDWDEDDDDDR